MKANVPVPMKLKPVENYIDKQVEKRFMQTRLKTYDIALMLALATLQDKFGYGQIRLQRFADRYKEIITQYTIEYGEAVYEALKHHTKIKLEDEE